MVTEIGPRRGHGSFPLQRCCSKATDAFDHCDSTQLPILRKAVEKWDRFFWSRGNPVVDKATKLIEANPFRTQSISTV